MDVKELIFNMYKDKTIMCNQFEEEIKEKYNITDDDARDLFVRIQNYQIFNMFKDVPVTLKKLKTTTKKYNMTKTESYDLFVRIQNYQINEYGRALNVFEDTYSKETANKVHDAARQRKRARKNRKM